MDHLTFAQLLGNYGEFVGAIAVVVTLGYLAVQIRQNTRALQREAHVDRARYMTDPLIGSPHKLAETLQKLNVKDGSVEAVTSEFMTRYDLEYEDAISVLRYLHRLWYTYEADYLFSGRSEQLDKIVAALISSFPNCRLFWEYEKDWLFTPQFIAYVDSFADGDSPTQNRRSRPA